MTRTSETATQGWVNTLLTGTLMIAAVVVLVDSARRWLRPRDPIAIEAPATSA
jgi:hypothetical protein